jgi:PTH1 family peptidyl-tRNA hydrolase
MWLVVGLGNPGAKYEHNRHNIGFLAVDRIAGKLSASSWSKKFGGEICEAPGAERTYLLKPQTFMNLSGESVAAAARFYKIPPENIIVLHDELDLLPGRLRVKQGGGSGGHNGIKSIDAHMGDNYWRVRIGIGHPGDSNLVSPYVLGDFPRDEWQAQEKMLDAVTVHFPLMLANDAAGFMNKVALTLSLPPPLPEKKPKA